MSTRPFKIVIVNGQPVRQDLTDQEIADAQARTAAENAEKQARASVIAENQEIQDFLILVASEHPQAPASVKRKADEIRAARLRR